MTATLQRGMMNGRWSEKEDEWQQNACADADPALFFPEDEYGEEPPYPSPEVKKICDYCPVRAQCLTKHVNEEFGIFGGTTGYQRELMTKKIHRKRCMGCGSTEIVVENKHDVCLGCGVSWEIL